MSNQTYEEYTNISLEEFKNAWSIKNILKYFGSVAVILLVLNFVFLIHVVPTESMYPEIKENSFCIGIRTILVNKISRYDIVTFRSDYDMNMVKRVIGMPGDNVSFKNGKVYINDVILDEPYLDKGNETICEKDFIVPQECYLLLGDNRENSDDSRYWDNPYITKDDIISKDFIAFGLTFDYGVYLHIF